MSQVNQSKHPGDDIIPDAPMMFNEYRTMQAPAEEIFPWVVQLGKSRGGWYLPKRWERVLPKSWAGARTIKPEFQELKIGDRVPDYGLSKDDSFNVVSINPPRSLVYTSIRYGTRITWAILLHESNVEGTDGSRVETTVHLRLRAGITSKGAVKRMIIWAAGKFDHATTVPMLAGLAERVEKDHAN
ncbi:hypothetical protein CGCVW01_v014165 [Colletotrichum viniferum]|nr:hypothetical protein CGCVW01_v014165 [Colletotrichum viniferum]